MSFEQLMDHANVIQAKAIKVAIDNGEATTHPGETPNKDVPSYPGDPFAPKFPYRESGEQGVRAYYADIPDLFRPFSQMPSPKSYQPMIDKLHTAMSNLCTAAKTTTPLDPDETYTVNPEMARMNGASAIMSHWSGVAAVNFKEKFLNPFDGYAQNQFTLVAALKGALEAQQSMWRHARDDIDNVAHKTIDALDHAGGCNPTTLTMALTVIGAFVPVLGVFEVVAEVEAAALTVELIAAGASTTAAMTPSYSYTGNTAWQATDAMKDMMKKTNDRIEKGKQMVDDAMTKLHQGIAGGNSGLFLAPRPELANKSGSDLDGDGGVGQPH